MTLGALAGLSCSGTPDEQMTPAACAASGLTPQSRLPTGDNDGHADPFGARAAGQARASRVRDAAWVRQPDNARGRARVGDYLLLNDRVAFYIEGARTSDGYASLGGEIIAADRVGDDGRPLGVSQYNETILLFSRQSIGPESVTVLADGADGKAAIVRVMGTLRNVDFFVNSFPQLLPDEFDLPVALDYVLFPGEDRVTLRLSLLNPTGEAIDFTGRQAMAFFQSSRSKIFTEQKGYGDPGQRSPFVIFDADAAGDPGRSAFGYRVADDLRFILAASGFNYFQSPSFTIDACGRKEVTLAELFVGQGVEGVRAGMRRADRDTSWRELRGQVSLGDGKPAAGAVVHVLSEDGGRYLTRTLSDATGAYKIQVPPQKVQVLASLPGLPLPTPLILAADATSAALQLSAYGTLLVRPRDAADNSALPARVQVYPMTVAQAAPPPDFLGIDHEDQGRLHQVFGTGDVTVRVPPGQHRVVVSRGPEYELFDKVVTVAGGQSQTLDAPIRRSVDSTGVMCADFHIHSYYSADSSDPVDYKVAGALADGLEIPVSSEHEWVIDFQPVIQRMGMTRFAFGVPSEEFTTFMWGHFGVIPRKPRPELVNQGVVQWYGRKPPEVFAEIAAQADKPVLIINHPSGSNSTGGSYFTAANLRRQSGTGDPGMWSDQFEAIEVFNDSDFEGNRSGSVADWFSILNRGKVAWAVGSSDSHGLRGSPVGYPRTCLRFGHDDPTRLSAEALRDALRGGAAVVSGGLFLTVSAAGGVGPGGMLPTGAKREFNVVVQAPSWLAATSLEVIVDGETQETITLRETVGLPGPARRYEATVTATPKAAKPVHWVVFHASATGRTLAPVDSSRRPFGVSNPIFF